MKSKLILLLTHDPEVGRQFHAALGEDATILVSDDFNEALRLVCNRLHELDFVAVDFPADGRDICFVAAVQSCRKDLPVIVLISHGNYHQRALAYAGGAAACLAKPATQEEIASLVESLRRSRSSPVFA